MSDCCTSIKNLGCIYSCDLVQTTLTAAQTGVFVLEKQPDGANPYNVKVVSNNVTSGQPIVFSGGYLNEDAVTVFKVIDPDGNYVETDAGEDCFQVDVKPSVNPTLADFEVDCPEPTCDDCDPAAVTIKNTDDEVLDTFNAACATAVSRTLADETFNVYIDGNLNQSFTVPALKSEDINISL